MTENAVTENAVTDRIRALSDRGFIAELGMQLGELSADRVTMTVPITEKLHQPEGLVHGGVYCAMVETLASLGAGAWFGDRGHVVGVANHTDFLRATRVGTLHAVATPIHRGRTQQLWLVEISDDEGRAVARGQVRLAILRAGEQRAAPRPRGAGEAAE